MDKVSLSKKTHTLKNIIKVKADLDGTRQTGNNSSNNIRVNYNSFHIVSF